MFLKSLELHGFKSFPEKTVLQFNSGATVIVGPNGSGKSNITDAMRWVLGELSSKSMRGSKMEDVIFIGADGYRPMSYAEVSVTFDNTDPDNRLNSPYDEITVTRRYSRGGDSDYLINRRPCRLRDIYELFMNTGIGREGYSIIGQGRVAEIISKKSEERRGIFEETAGISKFRYKKQESQRKLDEVEANMLRIADIARELEMRVGPLERESRKARQYLEYFNRKKKADVSLWLYDIEKIGADLTKAESDVKISSHELDLAEDSENMLSQQNERLFEASQDNKLTSQKLYEEIKNLRSRHSDIESKLASARGEISYSKLFSENLSRAGEKLAQSLKDEELRLEELAGNLTALVADIKEIEDQIACDESARTAAAVEKSALDRLLEDKLADIQAREEASRDLSVRLGVINNTMKERDGKREGILDEIAAIDKEVQSLSLDLDDVTAVISRYKEMLDSSEDEKAEQEATLSSLDDEIAKTLEIKNSSDGRIAALDGRIAALTRMQEHFDGYNNSVRFVMNEAKAGRLSGIVGPLSRVIKVKEEYIVAIECALGAALQNIITESEADAKAAMASLKRSGAGRATFYPITSVTPQSRSREVESAKDSRGFVGFADSLVEFDGRFSSIISSLLARIAVFTDIDSASDAARRTGWKLRAVTLDGQQINAGGSFTGGSVKRDSGMLTRNLQIESLVKERDSLASEIAELNAQLAKKRGDADSIRAKIRLAEEKRKLSEALLRGEESRKDEIVANRDVKISLSEKLKGDIVKIGEEAKLSEDNVRELEAGIAEIKEEIEKISEERNEIYVQAGALAERVDLLSRSLEEKRIKYAEKKRDESSILVLRGECLGRIDSFRSDIAENEREIAASEEKIKESIRLESEYARESEILSASLENKEDERAALEDDGMEFERKLNDLRIKLRDITAKKENLFRIHTKNESRLENLKESIDSMTRRLWDEYELTRSSAEALGYPAVTAENRAEIMKEFTEMKSAIKSLGHVNLDSIEEYVAVKERYDSITLQTEDLTKSKEDLLGIISSLEDEMKVMFLDAFNQVNKNFGEVFRELFDGGNAELELTDPADPLSSGIEIKAAPPGKMVKNLSLLSGGEQSFVAIALIFALIRVNPSPFCIFDEVESALDEINVQRVGRYIKRFSRDMQIIMITHRRGTMEIADELYGVTMPKHGVSRVFSLNLDEVGEDFAE